MDYSLSFGAFDENLLVGFIIIGVDSRNEKLTAFNTGTGVLPSYRGRKIVDMLFAHAFPLFISRGITHCGLEVIQDNTRARHVYERIGFAVSRTFLCFRGTLPAVSSVATLHPQSLKSCSIDLSSFQHHYSWEKHISSVLLSSSAVQCFEVSTYTSESRIGYFIINSTSGALLQCDVYEDSALHWRELFDAIAQISQTINITNVDSRRYGLIAQLRLLNLENYINQYEMVLIM